MGDTPRWARYPFLDHPGPLAFAHRGGAKYEPNDGIENTMAAFGNAVGLGYRYLETDVHATSDGVLIAFHDETLDRVTDRQGRIADMPFREVEKARIGGREPIPLLEDILDTWPDARLNIDVKEANAIEPLVRAVERTNAHDRICVSSFSGRRIKRARKLLGPEVASGLAPLGIALVRLPLPRGLGRLLVADVPCVQVPVSYYGFRILTKGFVDLAHALGKQVHVWTVDEPDEMRALLDLGVDGLITDRIDTLRDVLTERGQWTP
ncbi:glycerophosphodiester phosphodiesterase [Tenggerimyces flavus]|uniref:Glycerophosphodiester phosphodiesterase n=1 Tax=Tenggerimyces flavus TaxID=1708749 RepID=A0ABV7YDR4_9ACTN|nr:glycerophosphodiester phosphodiesterase [Tenggerimyces flavus]MBM7788181.1 glycerophosphoryl diester phosphodiesterase [Tenggerimyces flavus]